MTDYNAKSIVQLAFPEDIQRRIGVYLGGADEGAVATAIREPFDNSVDEAMNNFCDHIEVKYNSKTGAVQIRDNGRGFPVDLMEDGRSAIEVLCTVKHAGKFIARS